MFTFHEEGDEGRLFGGMGTIVVGNLGSSYDIPEAASIKPGH